MKKSFLTNIIAGSLFLCMALVSCGRKTVLIDDQLPKLTKAPPKVTEPDVVVPDEEEEEAAETTAVDMNDPDTTPHLKWGVWFAYNETESSYYIFENDIYLPNFMIKLFLEIMGRLKRNLYLCKNPFHK